MLILSLNYLFLVDIYTIFFFRPLESTQENVTRLTQNTSIVLPLTELCPTNKLLHVSCAGCGVSNFIDFYCFRIDYKIFVWKPFCDNLFLQLPFVYLLRFLVYSFLKVQILVYSVYLFYNFALSSVCSKILINKCSQNDFMFSYIQK